MAPLVLIDNLNVIGLSLKQLRYIDANKKTTRKYSNVSINLEKDALNKKNTKITSDNDQPLRNIDPELNVLIL